MAAYIDIAKQKECFYKVRLQAIERLAKVIVIFRHRIKFSPGLIVALIFLVFSYHQKALLRVLVTHFLWLFTAMSFSMNLSARIFFKFVLPIEPRICALEFVIYLEDMFLTALSVEG